MTVSEAGIEKACTDLLVLDGWRAIKMELNFSERKQKPVGEPGMADHLYIRYDPDDEIDAGAEVMWIEWKRLNKGGKPTKVANHQRDWHRDERARGALTLIAGEDFPATIEGFREWYETSSLMRKRITLLRKISDIDRIDEVLGRGTLAEAEALFERAA